MKREIERVRVLYLLSPERDHPLLVGDKDSVALVHLGRCVLPKQINQIRIWRILTNILADFQHDILGIFGKQ